jgi:hypothetical protein
LQFPATTWLANFHRRSATKGSFLQSETVSQFPKAIAIQQFPNQYPFIAVFRKTSPCVFRPCYTGNKNENQSSHENLRGSSSDDGCSMLDVGCWMFSSSSTFPPPSASLFHAVRGGHHPSTFPFRVPSLAAPKHLRRRIRAPRSHPSCPVVPDRGKFMPAILPITQNHGLTEPG